MNIDICWGTIELVPVTEQIGSQIRMGGYTIHRDRNGVETKRTPIEWNVVCECHSVKEAARLVSLR
jgi:hypothetical protein